MNRWLVRGGAVAALLLALVMRGHGPGILAAEGDQPATKPAPAAEKPPKAESPPAKVPKDPFAVPEGPPEEQLKFLQSLNTLRPEDPADEKARQAFNDKLIAAALKAADKILAGKPTDEQAEQAVRVKLQVLSLRAQTGDNEAQKALQALPEQLQKAGLTKLARRLAAALLQRRVIEAEAAGVEQLKKALQEVKAFLSAGTIGIGEAQLAAATADFLHRSGHPQLAIEANRDYAKLLARSEIPEIARFAKRLEGAARRLELPGKEMPLEGTQLDGKPLAWDQYRGKVVLVQFWATWCAPCRAEIQNILKSYKVYHDRGFEVVAISVDDDKQQVEQFVKENKLPWTVVFDQAAAGEEDKSMATRYGINGIPEIMLVGKDGKVVATEVRGPRLAQELEKLLGPPDKETPAPAKAPPRATSQTAPR